MELPDLHLQSMEGAVDEDLPLRKKRQRVKTACTNCARRKQNCDEKRPCSRCIRLGIAHTCVDKQPKTRGPNKRQKGEVKSVSSKDEPAPSNSIYPEVESAFSAPVLPPNPSLPVPSSHSNWGTSAPVSPLVSDDFPSAHAHSAIVSNAPASPTAPTSLNFCGEKNEDCDKSFHSHSYAATPNSSLNCTPFPSSTAFLPSPHFSARAPPHLGAGHSAPHPFSPIPSVFPSSLSHAAPFLSPALPTGFSSIASPSFLTSIPPQSLSALAQLLSPSLHPNAIRSNEKPLPQHSFKSVSSTSNTSVQTEASRPLPPTSDPSLQAKTRLNKTSETVHTFLAHLKSLPLTARNMNAFNFMSSQALDALAAESELQHLPSLTGLLRSWKRDLCAACDGLVEIPKSNGLGTPEELNVLENLPAVCVRLFFPRQGFPEIWANKKALQLLGFLSNEEMSREFENGMAFAFRFLHPDDVVALHTHLLKSTISLEKEFAWTCRIRTATRSQDGGGESYTPYHVMGAVEYTDGGVPFRHNIIASPLTLSSSPATPTAAPERAEPRPPITLSSPPQPTLPAHTSSRSSSSHSPFVSSSGPSPFPSVAPPP
eukprot:GCRY01002522.1.p1 GENE.GCRY01002522.1~~GCRY01002522.1.p1  ORF type:complete len:597 (+),score=86.38 GCRY01002522.1:304-2094(+)